MAFYGYAHLASKLNGTPDLHSDEIQQIKDVLKYLDVEQLSFIYALMIHNASLEGSYVINMSPPYGGNTLNGTMSPTFFEHALTPRMLKLIKLFLIETERT